MCVCVSVPLVGYSNSSFVEIIVREIIATIVCFLTCLFPVNASSKQSSSAGTESASGLRRFRVEGSRWARTGISRMCFVLSQVFAVVSISVRPACMKPDAHLSPL